MPYGPDYDSDALRFNPLHDYREVDVDAWSQVWFDELAQLDKTSVTYVNVERALATHFVLHPAIRPGDADDLSFMMELLCMIGASNPYTTGKGSISEQYRYDHWEQMRRLGQLLGRQIVRKTLEDAETYALLRIEQEHAGADYLTGVRNRRGLARRLENLCGITNDPVRRSETGEALEPVQMTHVYVDGNRFGSLNNHLGHHTGDAAIIEIAWQVQDLFRRSEVVVVYRHGGDEFGVILEGLSDHEADTAVSRIITQQTEKALGDTYRQALSSVVEKIRAVKQAGERLSIEARQRTLNQDQIAAGERPYHTLYINGEAITELRTLITLALGAKSGPVSNLRDVEELRRGAEIAMRGAKRVFHGIMGDDPLSTVQRDQ